MGIPLSYSVRLADQEPSLQLGVVGEGLFGSRAARTAMKHHKGACSSCFVCLSCYRGCEDGLSFTRFDRLAALDGSVPLFIDRGRTKRQSGSIWAEGSRLEQRCYGRSPLEFTISYLALCLRRGRGSFSTKAIQVGSTRRPNRDPHGIKHAHWVRQGLSEALLCLGLRQDYGNRFST